MYTVYTYMYLNIYIHIYIPLFIYRKGGRNRNKKRDIYIYTHVYIYNIIHPVNLSNILTILNWNQQQREKSHMSSFNSQIVFQ